MLRLNLSVPVTAQPNRLGVLGGDLQGFPNGRRLTDDVVDIELQALEGAAQTGKLVDALATGDKVDQNDDPFGKAFPYLALPNNTSVNTHLAGGAPAAVPTSPESPSATPSAMAGANDHTIGTGAMAASVGGAAVLAGGVFGGLWWRRRRRQSTVDELHAQL